MQEIKFRAWDGQKMFHPGMISEKSQNTHLMGFSGMNLMQYTGLKDKNGVEIYERDIVIAIDKFGNKDQKVIMYGHHEYEEDYGGQVKMIGFYVEPIKPCESICSFGYEIIGNIYENPELLK